MLFRGQLIKTKSAMGLCLSTRLTLSVASCRPAWLVSFGVNGFDHLKKTRLLNKGWQEGT